MNSNLEKYHVRVSWDITNDYSAWIDATDWVEAANIFIDKLRARVNVPEHATMIVKVNKKKCMSSSEPLPELS